MKKILLALIVMTFGSAFAGVSKFTEENYIWRTLFGAHTVECTSLTNVDVFSTTVDEDSAGAQKVLKVTATTDFVAGDWVGIGDRTAREEVGQIDSVAAGDSITLLSNLAYTHTAVQADAVTKINRVGPLTADTLYDIALTDTSGVLVGGNYLQGGTGVIATAASHPFKVSTGVIGAQPIFVPAGSLYLSILPIADNRVFYACPLDIIR